MVTRTVVADDLLAQAKAKGYERGEHEEQGEVQDRHRHFEKTKKDQKAALNRSILYLRLCFPCSEGGHLHVSVVRVILMIILVFDVHHG